MKRPAKQNAKTTRRMAETEDGIETAEERGTSRAAEEGSAEEGAVSGEE